MSTSSNIGIINDDRSVDIIYCHGDGYIRHQKPILLEIYNTEEKVRELINLGDISCLGRHIISEGPHDLDAVIAYHRDQEEDWEDVEPLHYDNMTNIEKIQRCEYLYLFDVKEKKWFVCVDDDKLTPLETYTE